MADIFISYSKNERHLTEALANDLEAAGYTVWWDTNLITGESYQKVIVREIKEARAAIVIWTPSSTQSEWVYSEANRANRDKKLIPVRVPEVDLYDIPPPFDVRQTDFVSNRRAIFAALERLKVFPVSAAVAQIENSRASRAPCVATVHPQERGPRRGAATTGYACSAGAPPGEHDPIVAATDPAGRSHGCRRAAVRHALAQDQELGAPRAGRVAVRGARHSPGSGSTERVEGVRLPVRLLHGCPGIAHCICRTALLVRQTARPHRPRGCIGLMPP